MRSSLLLSLVAILFVGCDGGANCPWERPSCCDNALFGCGPFDLPQGCSCGDYFSRSFRGAPLQKGLSQAPMTPNSMEGTWRVSLQKNGSGCSYLSKSTTATVLVRERKQQVSLKMLGFVTLRGNRSGKNVKPRGQFKLPLQRCSADISSDINLSSATSGAVNGTIRVACQNQALSCATSYSGQLKKM